MSYDTNSTQVDPVFGPRNTHIPFTAYLRYVPAESQGRRMVMIRDGQNTARMIQEDLTNAGWNIATPLSFVPQFGNTQGRITINGFFERDDATTDGVDAIPNFAPTNQVNVISAGTVPGEKTAQYPMDPGGGNLSWAQEPVTLLDTLTYELINSLQISSTVIGSDAIIDKVTIMGVDYGRGGRTFPS